MPWVGCSLHDLIQPSFSFLGRRGAAFLAGQPRGARTIAQRVMTLHALWRALVLVLLGVFLRSIGQRQTYWTFEDTLSQIGLGYGFLFLLGFRPAREQWAGAGADPRRLLGGLCALSAAGPGFRLGKAG